ncbi:MAG: GTP-binding protein, partial [Chloroflexota bacterium]
QGQIAFADVILLNKCDLVSTEELAALESRIRTMNAAAKVYRTENALIDMDSVLNVGGFDLDRALEVDDKFLELEYPFEWAGVYELDVGRYELILQEGPDDPKMDVALVPLAAATLDDDESLRNAEAAFAARATARWYTGTPIQPSRELQRLPLTEGTGKEMSFTVEISQPGLYGLFTEHHPSEFDLALDGPEQACQPKVEREFKPPHEHDDEVTSVGINLAGDLNQSRLNGWLGMLLRTQGQDIFRMKGVLSIANDPNRFVFQGVHMLFDGRPDRPWGDQPRKNELVFIGRNLDREALTTGFSACLN